MPQQRPRRRPPSRQILVERCISGWKEIEFEVMRDAAGNVIAVCSMENFDPVGVHTGDSHRGRPCPDPVRQGISDAAHRRAGHHLRLGNRGRLQLPVCPEPRLALNMPSSRSTPACPVPRRWPPRPPAIPSPRLPPRSPSATRLDEITNAVTGKTCACFEPTLDYVVVKLPKWPFDKFVTAKRDAGHPDEGHRRGDGHRAQSLKWH